jgi:hypothetical protein
VPDSLVFYDAPATSALQDIYKARDLTIKPRDSFEITAHGVEGTSLKIHSPSISRKELKAKLTKLHATIEKYL